MKKKLRLIVTNVCNRNCEGCCNKDWVYEGPKEFTVEQAQEYHTVIITGGEPLLYPEKVFNLMHKFNKVMLYTASICDETKLKNILLHPALVGLTFTIHDQKGFEDFKIFKKVIDDLIEKHNWSLMNVSCRVSIFVNDVKLEPIDLYGWDVKLTEWIKDCPLPNDEDFGVLQNSWGRKKF